MILYTARVLIPVAGPLVEDAAVAVAGGRIVRCGPRAEVSGALPRAERRDLGCAALLPGLVNAHTHLELSWLAADPPAAGDWVEWVRALLSRRAAEDREQAIAAAERALAHAAARGTVALGDVGNHGWSAAVLARSGLHGVHFHEVYGLREEEAERRLADARARTAEISRDPDVRRAAGRIRVVASPHAPHTTSAALLRSLATQGELERAPLTIHVAESAAECEFLESGAGPFAALVLERGLADAAWSPPRATPVEYLDRLGVLRRRTLAVHCVRLGALDVTTLGASGATVVTCPRSNRRLGVGTAPIERLLAAGVPVALGTDSAASAPDLDMLAEIAALREDHPSLDPGVALRIATANGAAALGLAADLGSVEAGKLARLLAIPLEPGDDPLEAVCSNPPRVYRLDAPPPEACR